MSKSDKRRFHDEKKKAQAKAVTAAKNASGLPNPLPTTWEKPWDFTDGYIGVSDALRVMPPEALVKPLYYERDSTKWGQFFNDWFFRGVSKIEMVCKPGIEKDKVLRHISIFISSFAPSQEHKVGSFIFLCSQWLEDVTYEVGNG